MLDSGGQAVTAAKSERRVAWGQAGEQPWRARVEGEEELEQRRGANGGASQGSFSRGRGEVMVTQQCLLEGCLAKFPTILFLHL